MANLTSKLVVGGSVVVVLLMLFSAIPVAAEESNDNPVNESIEVDGDSPETKDEWEWNGSDTFTFKQDITVSRISITSDAFKHLYVHVNSTVTVNCNMSGVLFAGFSGVTVDGGGKLTINDGLLQLTSSSGTDQSIIENVSICLFSEQRIYPIIVGMNLTIRNCPSIKIEMSDKGGITEGAFTINVAKKLTVLDSNIEIKLITDDTGANYLIATGEGIILSEPPSGSNLIFSNGQTEYSEWNDNVTLILSRSKESALIIGEIPEPESSSSINMYDVSLYATAAAAVVLILVGSLYAGKH